MAFQAEQKVKIQILCSLGTDQVFRLLSDHEVGVVMKTLGLLRNLLSTKPHIDLIMVQHGREIMQVNKSPIKKLMETICLCIFDICDLCMQCIVISSLYVMLSFDLHQFPS